MKIRIDLENDNGKGWLVISVAGDDHEGLEACSAYISLAELKAALELEGAL